MPVYERFFFLLPSMIDSPMMVECLMCHYLIITIVIHYLMPVFIRSHMVGALLSSCGFSFFQQQHQINRLAHEDLSGFICASGSLSGYSLDSLVLLSLVVAVAAGAFNVPSSSDAVDGFNQVTVVAAPPHTLLYLSLSLSLLI